MSLKSIPRATGPVAFGVVVLTTLIIGVIAGLGMGIVHDTTNGGDLLRFAAISVAAMVLALLAGVWWWRQIDEAAREAHKWAWWWGGSSAMGLAAAVMLAFGYAHEILPPGIRDAPPEHLIAIGGLFVILCEVAGYCVAWCVWWLRRM